MSTLSISVDNTARPFSYTMVSGPAGATVASGGDIDVSACAETDIGLQWTLDTGTFRTSGNSPPVTISGNGAGQVFTNGSLSNGNKTYKVTDKNPQNAPNRQFNYTIHTNQGDGDPVIRNRA